MHISWHGGAAADCGLDGVCSSGSGRQERHLRQEDQPGVTGLAEAVHRPEQAQLSTGGGGGVRHVLVNVFVMVLMLLR